MLRFEQGVFRLGPAPSGPGRDKIFSQTGQESRRRGAPRDASWSPSAGPGVRSGVAAGQDPPVGGANVLGLGLALLQRRARVVELGLQLGQPPRRLGLDLGQPRSARCCASSARVQPRRQVGGARHAARAGAFIRPNSQRSIQPSSKAATSAPAIASVSSLRSIVAPDLLGRGAARSAIRRFCARPSAVALSATGSASP